MSENKHLTKFEYLDFCLSRLAPVLFDPDNRDSTVFEVKAFQKDFKIRTGISMMTGFNEEAKDHIAI